LVALIFGGTMIGFAGIFMRLADTGPVASAFWRMALAVPVLWIACWRWHAHELKFLRGYVWSGFLFAADMAVWHLSLSHTTVANATLGSNLAPVVLALWAWLRHGRRFSQSFLLGLAGAMIGATMLAGPHFSSDDQRLWGDFLALITAFLYAAYQAAVQKLRAQSSTLPLMAWGTLFSALFLLPMALIDQRPFFPQTGKGWLTVIALAISAQVFGQVFIAYALKHIDVTIASVLLLVQPLTAACAAYLLFAEVLSGWQLLGGSLLLAAIVIVKRSEGANSKPT
jgi:drug/metabolite transporter (DMT)-like permease